MTDKLTPEQVANLAEKGTQGAWRYEGGRTVYAKARETLDGNKDGALAVIVTHHENDWFSEFDSQRIANVPAMETLIASQATEIERLREALEWYGEQARLARLIHSEGDAGRHALQEDGGKKARTTLNGDTNDQ